MNNKCTHAKETIIDIYTLNMVNSKCTNLKLVQY